MFHRFLVVDLYDPVWPNIVASIIWATPAFLFVHLKLRRIHAAVIQGQENKETNGAGIREEKRRPGVLCFRKQRQDKRPAALRKERQVMALSQFKTGFWVTVGVIGAFVIVGWILGVFEK